MWIEKQMQHSNIKYGKNVMGFQKDKLGTGLNVGIKFIPCDPVSWGVVLPTYMGWS